MQSKVLLDDSRPNLTIITCFANSLILDYTHNGTNLCLIQTTSVLLIVYSIATIKFVVQLKLFAFEIKQNKIYIVKK